jgi:hypothetical protein
MIVEAQYEVMGNGRERHVSRWARKPSFRQKAFSKVAQSKSIRILT